MNKKRVLAKAITWRVVSIVITLLLARAFGIPAFEASAFALWHAIISTIAYLAHEGLWNRKK